MPCIQLYVFYSMADKNIRIPLLSREQCRLRSASCYCEENVFRILTYAAHQGYNPSQLYALFITNSQRCVPYLKQAAVTHSDPHATCYWDYHVIAIITSNSNSSSSHPVVYDIDSILPFPSPLSQYIEQSFNIPAHNPSHSPQFRVIHYSELKNSFSSDRRHMLKHPNFSSSLLAPSDFRARPPPYPCIKSPNNSNPNTLPTFLRVPQLPETDSFALMDNKHMASPGAFLPRLIDLFTFFQRSPTYTNEERTQAIEMHK